MRWMDYSGDDDNVDNAKIGVASQDPNALPRCCPLPVAELGTKQGGATVISSRTNLFANRCLTGISG
jgi:hypothetical protein